MWLDFCNCVQQDLRNINNKLKVKVKLLCRVQLFVTPWTVAYQAPLSMESPGKNTGVGCYFFLQGIFPTQGSNPGLPNCRQILYHLSSLVAQSVKSLSAMQETQVQSLCEEDPLEKEMATHSNILAWRIPWTEEPGGLQSMGSQRVGHD